MFLTIGTVNKSYSSVLESPLNSNWASAVKWLIDLRSILRSLLSQNQHQVLSFPVKIWQSLAHGWPLEPGCKQTKWLAGLDLDNGSYLRSKYTKNLIFNGQKQHCKSETAFSWVSSYSTLVVVLQDGGQQPHESLISCLKVMFLLNQVLFSPKIVILMDRGAKEEHFVMI